VYDRWNEQRLTQEEAADLLGVSERQFRRQCRRFESDGLDGLIDLRLGQVSSRRARVDEVLRLVNQYRDRYTGWTVKHLHSNYREQKEARSYNFVRLMLQQAGLVAKAKRSGAHRRKRLGVIRPAAPHSGRGRRSHPLSTPPAARRKGLHSRL
jgi:transposase